GGEARDRDAGGARRGPGTGGGPLEDLAGLGPAVAGLAPAIRAVDRSLSFRASQRQNAVGVGVPEVEGARPGPARIETPDTGCAVRAGHEQPLTVRTEGQPRNFADVAERLDQFPSLAGIPHLNQPAGTDRGHAPPVVA